MSAAVSSPPGDGSTPKSASLGAFGWIALVVACAILAALALPTLDAPWEHGFRGINGGGYYGPIVKNHHALGLDVTKLGGVTLAYPTTPPIFVRYFHHTQLYGVLQYGWSLIFGVSEGAMRGCALFVAVAGIVGVFLTLRRVGGAVAAGLGALAFAGLPAWSYWGLMTSHEPLVVAACAWTNWAYFRFEERPTGARYAALSAAFLAAGASDWSGFFVGAGLFLVALSAPRGETPGASRKRIVVRVVALAPLSLIVAVVHWAHYGIALGDFGAGFSSLVGLGAGATTAANLGGDVGLWSNLTKFARELWTIPGLALCGVGVVAGLVRGGAARRTALFAIAATAPGVLNAATFAHHASIHDFWTIGAAPGIAAGIAAAAVAFGGDFGTRARKCGLAAAVVLTVVVAVVGIAWSRERAATDATTLFKDAAAFIDSQLEPDAVLATNGGWHQVIYYVRLPYVPSIKTPEQVSGLFAQLEASGIDRRRLVFMLEGEGTPELRKELEAFGDRVEIGPISYYRAR